MRSIDEIWRIATDGPWSGAFISWCFKYAAPTASSRAIHLVYIDRIRRHAGMSEALVLKPVAAGLCHRYRATKGRRLFSRHVDIVVGVTNDRRSSIGSNVSDLVIGGSVTPSTWRFDKGLLV